MSSGTEGKPSHQGHEISLTNNYTERKDYTMLQLVPKSKLNQNHESINIGQIIKQHDAKEKKQNIELEEWISPACKNLRIEIIIIRSCPQASRN